ncbi:hypothetical protein [Kribbella sp. NPDC051620]|uniref:hypothetical protein n=1 Tax=Kribbella sp. NPDC051620 TaxID=3364120 RepID=UPI00379E6808
MSSEGPDPDMTDRDAQDSDPPDRDAPEQLERDAPGPLEIEQPSGPGRYPKVRARASSPLGPDLAADTLLTAVIEVTEPGYRPPGVDVRGFITETLLTGGVRPSEFAELDQDPRVVSIELGSQADQID